MPIPAVGDIVQVDGRFGLLYERVLGDPLMKQLEERPWQLGQVAHTLAQLQAQIHTLCRPQTAQSTRTLRAQY